MLESKAIMYLAEALKTNKHIEILNLYENITKNVMRVEGAREIKGYR